MTLSGAHTHEKSVTEEELSPRLSRIVIERVESATSLAASTHPRAGRLQERLNVSDQGEIVAGC